MSTFVSKEFGTKDMNDYYELKELTNKATASLNKLKEIGTPEEQQAYREKNQALLQADRQVNRISENLSKLKKQERQLIESKDIDAATKEEKLREYKLRELQMVSRVKELRKQAGL
jgi:division protein CdvB (Snf7/Vps24/ESCRT-III family)